MVVGFCDKCLLKSRSVTKSPAVIPLSGTSQSVSENRSLAGLVQISRWSPTNLPTNPVCVPLDNFKTAFPSGGLSVFEEELCFSEADSDAAGFVPCSCAYDTLVFPTLNSSVVPRIVIRRLVLICPQGMATAATNAADDAICATDKTFFKVLLPRTGFSGTTIVSPGPTVAESTLPDQKPPCLPPVTEPSERP